MIRATRKRSLDSDDGFGEDWTGTSKDKENINTVILSQLFRAIDSAMVYYLATSFNKHIAFPVLKARVAQLSKLTLDIVHMQQIIAIWPDAYVLEWSPELKVYTVLCGSKFPLPVKANMRREQFVELMDYHGSNGVIATSSMNRFPLLEIDLNEISPIMQRKRQNARSRADAIRAPESSAPVVQIKNEGSTVLDRIRAREEAQTKLSLQGKSLEQQKDEAYRQFLISKIPQICDVLISLVGYGRGDTRTISFQAAVKHLGDSMKSRMSVQEISDAFEILSQQVSSFCKVIYSGGMKVIKVRGGWTSRAVVEHLN